MSTPTHLRRAATVAVALGVVSVAASTPALAAGQGADHGVDVVNTETVQVYMSPQGKIDTQRVYEQLDLTGRGRVNLVNPVSPSGLRNLDGFSGFAVKDGKQTVDTTVDGEKSYRTVSDFRGDLPLSVTPTYTLDGKTVEPGDIVGGHGHLKVSFTVENTTGEMQDVHVPDGKGGTVSRRVEVAIPVVGSLTTTAPPSFSNVSSSQANLAGDGKGGTKLSFTMTLFPPIGATTSTFGYEADIADGEVPRVEVTALPVNPLKSPTFASAAKSYQGGADTGARLLDGAGTIDANLLKLRDGSAELLAGLIKLRDGAGELKKGLADKAVPGSAKLADGAHQLDSGVGRLDTGAGQLATGTDTLVKGTGKLASGAGQLDTGASKLATGTGTALAGSQKLVGGLKQISGGLGTLADSKEGLPKASAGIEQLKTGVDTLIANIAASPTFSPSNPLTLLDGLKALKLGIGSPAADQTLLNGVYQLQGGLKVLAHGDGTSSNPGLSGIGSGLTTGADGLDSSVNAGGKLDQLKGALTQIANLNPGCSADPQCKGTLLVLAGQVGTSKTDLTNLRDGLRAASGGLTKATAAIDGQFVPGTTGLIGGLDKASAGVDKLIAGVGDQGNAKTILGGLALVRGGLVQLADGVGAAVAGIAKLNAGASDAAGGGQTLSIGLGKIDGGADQLAAGTGQLKSGAGQVDSGAKRLGDGAQQLAAGTGTAKEGSAQLANGAGQLASGLKDAGAGSTLLAQGLITAATQAPAIPDGATRLSNEGTKKLVAAGQQTTLNYGEMVAVLKAGAQRAETQDMAIGAPKGATGLTAYSFVLTGDDGEGGRNMARALGSAAVLGATGGIFFLRRRFLA